MLMDGWCVGILNSEFLRIYFHLLANKPFQLPPIRPFRTYIQWLEKQDREASKTYWKEYLDSYEEAATIPKIKAHHSNEGGYKQEKVDFFLEKEKTNLLNALGAKNHVTMNIINQTTWGIVVGKYNGKEDVVFGSVVSGRPFELEGVESIVGLFINTVPVRIRFHKKTNFNKLLQQVQEEAINSESYHYHPLAEIQAETVLKQDLIGHLYIFENYPVVEQIQGYEETNRQRDENTTRNDQVQLHLSNVDVFEQTNYDFNIILAAGDRLYVKLEYNGNVYDRDYVEQIALHFRQVLDQVIHNEAIEIGELTLLSGEERRRILYDFNDTRAEIPGDKLIHQLFEEQVAQTPDTIALIDQHYAGKARQSHQSAVREKHLTYSKLNQESHRLVNALRKKGIQADNAAGIMLERSMETVIAILERLKAGSAYLPIDPEYPPERIRYMLNDSSAKTLLTTWSLAEEGDKLKRWAGETILLEPGSCPGRAEASSPAPNQAALTDQLATCHLPPATSLAYIIYTSGSTGKPRGVMVEHQSVNYTCWAIRQYVQNQAVSFPLFTSLAFDLTVTSIFTPLLSGNTLLIYGEENKEPLINRVIEENRAGVVKLTPSHLKLLLEQKLTPFTSTGRKIKTAIKGFIVGGEALETKLSRDIIEKFHHIPVIYNEYGPTEATVGCMIHIFSPGTDTRQSVPIGIPAQNVRIYLLDKNIKPVPVGVLGELYISGNCLARGYLNQPELTGERFLKNPFVPGKKMYRTGDLSRHLPGSTIEFLGRIDQQVKIRGFRIELEEIETKLKEYRKNGLKEINFAGNREMKDRIFNKLGYDTPPVKDAVVMAREVENGDLHLTAYLVSDEELPPNELREYLRGELPGYMIPSFFMTLDAIPLTPNGKIDRKALPKPGIKAGEEYIAPRNVLEESLARIWSETLGIEKTSIGINDNFFNLGGHSLNATVMVSKIHKVLDVRINLPKLFEFPTIKGLIQYIREASPDKFISLEAAEKREYYPLSSSQKRLFILQQRYPDNLAYNMTSVFISDEKLDNAKLEAAFAKLLQRHETLRTSFLTAEGEPVQKVHDKAAFALEYYDTPGIKDTGMEPGNTSESPDAHPGVQALIREFNRPFDLSRAPLLRVGIINNQNKQYFLVTNMHHIISDGVSREVLIRDFVLLYIGQKQSRLRIHYKDFTQWQKKLHDSGEMKKQEEFWLKEFAGELPGVNIPLDYPRPEIQDFAGNNIGFALDAKESEFLKTMTHEKGATLFMVLLALYNLLLAKLSGKEDIIVGTGIAGRQHADLQQVIGMFVNTLAIRNAPTADKTFNQFLEEVKEKTLQALDNQDYFFEDLVVKVGVPRQSNRNPLFDTALVMENTEDAVPVPGSTDLPGEPPESQPGEAGLLKLRPYGTQNQSALFDMSFFCWEAVDGTLGVNINYRTSLFKEKTIEMFIGYFKEIVTQVVANENIKLGDIRLTFELGAVESDILEQDTGDFGF
jgi:tyrocidine synthetase-3